MILSRPTQHALRHEVAERDAEMATDGCKEPKLECRFGRQLGAARVASRPPRSTIARRASSCPHLTATAQRFVRFVRFVDGV